MTGAGGSRPMPQVNVAISGRTYRMACGEGEEEHLAGLAALFDARIAELRETFGEIGDMRLHVMAALTIADELGESRRRLASLGEELAGQRLARAEAEERAAGLEARATETVVRAAERVERLARGLGAVPGVKLAGDV